MEKEKKNPLDPIEKTSYACSICGALKDTEDEARKCAMDDTSKLEIDKVTQRDGDGYPRVFIGSFRTGVSGIFARAKDCTECAGSGEVRDEESGSVYPCECCGGSGMVVAK